MFKAEQLTVSSILLNNFPKKFGFMNRHDKENNTWENKPSSFTGFDISQEELNLGYISAIRKLFICLLLHDVIYLRHNDYLSCLTLIGHENMIKMLESGCIKIVYDFHDFTWSLQDQSYELGFMMRLAPAKDLVEGYTSITHPDRKIESRLRYLTEQNQILLNNTEDNLVDEDLPRSIITEVLRDTSNKQFCERFNLEPNKFSVSKSLVSLRLCDILTGYLLQHKLGVNEIIQDAFSKNYVRSKLVLASVSDRSTDCFESILNLKGVPDLLDLYSKNIISFDEILAIRNQSQAISFRYWIKENDYDREQVTRELLKPCKSKLTSKLISFIFPNVVGLINPVAGISASAVDSFFLQMLKDKWNPKLFLDDSLSKFLDDKISASRTKELKQKRESYTKIQVSDPCYCGSGKIYGKCHGK